MLDIDKLFNTKCLDYGNNLSGGEKHKIQLVQNIIKRSSVYIFDEPDSMLD